MRQRDIRKNFGAAVSTGALALTACTGTTQQQGAPGGGMMGGGGYGSGWMSGYGGPWVLILLVAIVALLAWLVVRGKNKH